jgi:hypothetical protein
MYLSSSVSRYSTGNGVEVAVASSRPQVLFSSNVGYRKERAEWIGKEKHFRFPVFAKTLCVLTRLLRKRFAQSRLPADTKVPLKKVARRD